MPPRESGTLPIVISAITPIRSVTRSAITMGAVRSMRHAADLLEQDQRT